jgi:hypothetical protein
MRCPAAMTERLTDHLYRLRDDVRRVLAAHRARRADAIDGSPQAARIDQDIARAIDRLDELEAAIGAVEIRLAAPRVGDV